MIENLWRMSIYGSVMILLVRLLIPIFIAGRGSLQPDLQVFNWPSVVRVLKLIYLAGMILTVAAFLVHQDMEMHCDESVMEEASTPERKTYSDILLKLSAKQSGLTGLYLGESHTEKRIKNVLQGRKKRTIFVILFFTVFGVFCGGAFWTVPRGRENTASSEAVNEQGMNMVTKEYSIEEMPVYLERVILSDTPVNSGGITRYVQLVMTEGEYFTEEYAGSGGGTYMENYRGTYEL